MSPSLGIELSTASLSQYWDRDYGYALLCEDHVLVEEGLLPRDWEANTGRANARIKRVITIPAANDPRLEKSGK